MVSLVEGKLQLLERITKVKQRITKVIVLRGGGVRWPKGWWGLSLLKKTTAFYPLGDGLSSAQHDHFRYPLFHFCYPFKQLPFFLLTSRAFLQTTPPPPSRKNGSPAAVSVR